jgi:probable rRNA maturation factor
LSLSVRARRPPAAGKGKGKGKGVNTENTEGADAPENTWKGFRGAGVPPAFFRCDEYETTRRRNAGATKPQMIANRQRRVLVAMQPLQEFYERVRVEMKFPPESVAIQLISDDAMARLNRTYRHKHGPTDVLSFPANGSRPSAKSDYIGDIAISPATARRNARRFARPLAAELRILILHGMIHLAGYDHETDHGEMDRIERKLRRRLGVG